MSHRPLVLLMVTLLSACANVPRFDLSAVDPAVEPAGAVRDFPAARGHRVHWGGSIIDTVNLKDSTRIEILAYPVDRQGRPDLTAKAQGRFILLHDGYLEAANYAPGRMVSAVGTLAQLHEGRVGDARVVYPLVHAEQIYLWPKSSHGSEPQFHFGIGVGIMR